MDYSVLNSRPVLDYDVSRGRVALILWEDEPNAYVQGRKVEVREPEQVRWVGDNLALVADSGGSEKRSIYLYDGSLHELLADGNDNVDPTFVREDRFLFISNRDGRTTHLYLYDGGEVTRLSEGSYRCQTRVSLPQGGTLSTRREFTTTTSSSSTSPLGRGADFPSEGRRTSLRRRNAFEAIRYSS
ncbi:hypothetical protein [Sulfodiicoccus acidiphilus]|uniref:hypothetical protein n=1 Tax=Sulfodiicoccus acidiphilus TaxID=1670455 RepID=UPI00267D36BA